LWYYNRFNYETEKNKQQHGANIFMEKGGSLMECKSKKKILLILLGANIFMEKGGSLMECKSKKKLLLILLTAFVLFTFAPNVFATVDTPSFPTINVNQLTPTTIQRFNTEFEQNNLSYKMFIGSDGKTYLNVWSDGSGARDVYVWSATDNKWTFSATLSSNKLVKGAEEPQTPATSRYATWDEYVRSISGGKSGEGGQAPNIPTGSSGYAGVIIPILLAGAAAAAGGYVGSGVVFDPAPLPSCNTVTCTAVTGCIPANYNQKTPTVPITPAPLSIIELQIGNPVFKLNNQALLLDSPPVIKNDRTLLPIRAVVEAMGGQVNWNAEERRVDIEYRGKTVTLWIGKNTAKVNGKEVMIDPSNPNVVPEIINGRTMLPLRFVAEALGCEVKWDDATKTITILFPSY